VRHDDAFVTRADNRVGFPVADAAFLGDNRGALAPRSPPLLILWRSNAVKAARILQGENSN
jgi:hypothetical protein